MDIKSLILSILEGRELDSVDIVQAVERHSPNESLYEIPTGDLLNYTVPYIRGAASDRPESREKSLEYFSEYCDDCEYLGLVDKEVVELCRENSRAYNREARIRLANRLGRFRFGHVDWDDREWVVGLVEHLYIRAMKNIEYLRKEMELSENRGSEGHERKDGVECIRIDTRGRRERMLVNRIEPTLTLEEFADKLLSNMRESSGPSLEEESSSEKYSREELMRRDEDGDTRSINRGNTTGMG